MYLKELLREAENLYRELFIEMDIMRLQKNGAVKLSRIFGKTKKKLFRTIFLDQKCVFEKFEDIL